MIPLWLLGGGGHARVVLDAARTTGAFEILGILDDTLGRSTKEVDGVPVLGPITSEMVQKQRVEHAVIAIGDNAVRAAIARRLDGLVSWASIIHARAYVAPSARIGSGCVVFASSVVQPGAAVGNHAIVNTGSTVDHDVLAGNFVHVGPGATLGGMVSVGEGALIGLGARVIPARRVGAWTTVGAGAVVVRDIPDNATAVGVPARVIERPS